MHPRLTCLQILETQVRSRVDWGDDLIPRQSWGNPETAHKYPLYELSVPLYATPAQLAYLPPADDSEPEPHPWIVDAATADLVVRPGAPALLAFNKSTGIISDLTFEGTDCFQPGDIVWFSAVFAVLKGQEKWEGQLKFKDVVRMEHTNVVRRRQLLPHHC